MFKKAVPVYAENLSDKMNTHIILTESLPSLKGYSVKISAASFYKLFINDTFVGFGPARTAKGYARVDCYDATHILSGGKFEFDENADTSDWKFDGGNKEKWRFFAKRESREGKRNR